MRTIALPIRGILLSGLSLNLHISVTRSEFEAWIADELRAIERCIDSLLESSGVGWGEVDRVFLTGGSSFVPAAPPHLRDSFWG